MDEKRNDAVQWMYAKNLVDIAALRGKGKTITVEADFDTGPWVWEKDPADKDECLDLNIHQAGSGLTERYSISDELKHDFANWIMFFVCCAHYNTFHWDSFHRQGMELAKRLKQELGDRIKVVYTKPIEDPHHKTNEQTEII